MQPTSEAEGGRRLALVIATSSYSDPTLEKLRSPGKDATDLAEVLANPAIGGFEVEPVLDARTDTIRRRIAQFCSGGGPRDLALIYLSCHGVLDDRGRLYYATADTERELLSVTAVPAAWLNEQLEDCRCRRQILVLDCCHSGAFARGAKGGEAPLALRDRFEGRGRVIVTASRATEYSFEGDRIVGEGASSVFTSALVEGLRTGDADGDRNGVITVNELYDYAYQAVKAGDARQTPSLWTHGVEGTLLVAHSPRGPVVEPAPLPEDLRLALESPRSRVREVAVGELADVLAGGHAGLALTARDELTRIAAEDLPRVADVARGVLEAHPAAPFTPVREQEAARPLPALPESESSADAEPSPERDADGTDPLVDMLSRTREENLGFLTPRENDRDRRSAPGKGKQGQRRALIGSVLILIVVAGIVAVVALRDGGSDFKSGPYVAMREVGSATESATANLIKSDSSSPTKLALNMVLTEGKRYRLLFFDDPSRVESFSALPDGVKVASDTGPGGALDPLGDDPSDAYTNVDFQSSDRDYEYFGIARTTRKGGELVLSAKVDALVDPA
jgi:hypothetical protein